MTSHIVLLIKSLFQINPSKCFFGIEMPPICICILEAAREGHED
jgi:hypothetical protein